MNVEIPLFAWTHYSKKTRRYISRPAYVGRIDDSQGEKEQYTLIHTQVGDRSQALTIEFWWLVNHTDGVICDVKYQFIGPTALVAFSEALCRFVIQKNYAQANRTTIPLLEKQLRDHPDTPALVDDAMGYGNMLIESLDQLAAQCGHIPLSEPVENTP